jgi:hypothetical protein
MRIFFTGNGFFATVGSAIGMPHFGDYFFGCDSGGDFVVHVSELLVDRTAASEPRSPPLVKGRRRSRRDRSQSI